MDDAPIGPIIETVGLRKTYRDVVALNGIDLAVRNGERIVIMGASGSGKSTYVRCLNGLEPIASGSILYQGRNIAGLPESGWRAIRRSIGMVFQDYSLFPHLTVMQNLTFAPVHERLLTKDEAAERALALLDRVGLRDKASSYPAQLSGGQQQRIAIVRAMMMKPLVMLFDEPTSALDPETVGEVLAIIADLTSEGLTSITVTHEMGFARRCADRVVYMDRGRIVEIGTPNVFFTEPRTERARRFLASNT